MDILVVAQKVDKNDGNLGFFVRWLEEFAGHYSKVLVIASQVGEYDLPDNVFVFSLGKEKKKSKFLRIWKFWELFSQNYIRADAVFFHMIPEFVLAASPFLAARPKPSALWYVHKSVTRSLKLAERFVDYVFSASALSFRLPSKKVIYTGHAIDTEFFKPAGANHYSGGLRILCLGRISPVKDIESVIRTCAILKEKSGDNFVLSIVGGPRMPRDEKYLASLKKFVLDKNLASQIVFQGERPFAETPSIYNEHDVFISTSTTGSLDKSVLEAMACGLSVVTSNEAFRGILPPPYFLENKSPEFLAERVLALARENRPNLALREVVTQRHSLQKTIKEIAHYLA